MRKERLSNILHSNLMGKKWVRKDPSRELEAQETLSLEFEALSAAVEQGVVSAPRPPSTAL